MLKFPDKFYWGTATSAYQVEGGIRNDWSMAGEKYDAGLACDHYNRFEEDFDLVKQMNNNAHRFSIEWARVEPEQGKFDQKEIEHYRKVILALKQRNLEPFVTLYHWTLPIWFAKKGGWLNKDAPKYFERFVEKIVLEYEDLVKFWITLNEPNVYASWSYLAGKWPPFKRGFKNLKEVMKQLVEAHELAYEKIHQISNQAKVGITSCNIWYKGIIRLFLNYKWNYWFFEKIKDHQDFVGINYYFKISILSYIFNRSKTDLGWRIIPEGIYHVLMGLKKYNKPAYIFENGLADKNDTKRAKFIIDHLKWTHKAIEEGVDPDRNGVNVQGYFHWSLLDNFEWEKGFKPRFGLVKIDYKNNLQRIPRPSSKVYAEICKNNAI